MLGNQAEVLFDDGHHKCLMFYDLVKGHGIQANQFLILDGDNAALIDPGGDLTYAPLSVALGRYCDIKNLRYVLASHQDPDIISALGRWMMQSPATVVCSKLWSRFLPHLASSYLDELHKHESRIMALPDRGGIIQLGDSEIYAVPAHFLHSVGNFNFYDRTSGILFSGDMGASVCDGGDNQPVEDFDAHVQHMKGFHRRYMCSSKASGYWANMIRDLKVEMIVPQHGKRFVGENIHRFLDWVAELKCGTDVIRQSDYVVNLLNDEGQGLASI